MVLICAGYLRCPSSLVLPGLSLVSNIATSFEDLSRFVEDVRVVYASTTHSLVFHVKALDGLRQQFLRSIGMRSIGARRQIVLTRH
jgi:hypothetical protein